MSLCIVHDDCVQEEDRYMQCLQGAVNGWHDWCLCMLKVKLNAALTSRVAYQKHVNYVGMQTEM